MNFLQMQRRLLVERRRVSSDSIVQDWELQLVKDELNQAYEEIMDALKPYYWRHVKTTSFTTAAGTTVYTLADDCVQPLEFWTQDTRARPIRYVDPITMDESGFRNSNLSLSYVDQITWYDDTTAASSSGAAGGSEGASITNNTTALTKAGGTAWSSDDVGSIIRLDGWFESEISAVGGTDACTLSRTFIGRLNGDATTNTPEDLTQVKWEVTPPGTRRIQIPQTLTNAETVHYRYVNKHWPMIVDTDIPDRLPERAHKLVLQGAICLDAEDREKQKPLMWQRYQMGISELVQENRAAVASELRTYYEANDLRFGLNQPFPRDTDFRASRRPGRRM